MNMTLDGYCDHTAMIADDEIHQHYTDLLLGAGAVLYGRTTYQLMEFWLTILKNPTGEKHMDDFAVAIDSVPKVVFSRTLKQLDWKTARVATKGLQEEVTDLKQQPGKDIFVGSPSLIVATSNLGLVDEYQLCIHPTIVGGGLRLFNAITDRIDLNLLRTKPFACGAVTFYYESKKK